jgi:hypothetical protein
MTNSKTRKIKKKTEGLKPKDLAKKCYDSYCKNFVIRDLKKAKEIFNKMRSTEKKRLVKMKNDLKLEIKKSSKFESKDTVKKREIFVKDMIKFSDFTAKKFFTKMKNDLKHGVIRKKSLKYCKSSFCNFDCKGTIFEDGDGKKLPSSMIETINLRTKGKTRKLLIDFITGTRKELFKNKKTILKDHFYEKLKSVPKLKKEGAISGCVKEVVI